MVIRRSIKELLSKNSLNLLTFVNISPTSIIDTSMEMSSRVLQHENPKFDFLSTEKLEIDFDLC